MLPQKPFSHSACFLLFILGMLLASTTGRAQSPVVTSLYSFGPLNSDGLTNQDGAHPVAALTPGSGGLLYGVARDGGAGGTGTVFALSPLLGVVTLHSFAPLDANGQTNGDGAHPTAALTLGADGNLYGTTQGGGAGGTGTVFQMTPAGTLTTLHAFAPFQSSGHTNLDGAHPNAALLVGSSGSISGTTSDGGAGGTGTVFQLTPNGSLTTLHAFSSLTNNIYVINSGGAYPYAGLAAGADGSLYGMTSLGMGPGNGNIFKISPDGTFSVVHTFSTYINTAMTGGDGIGNYNSDGGSGAGLSLSSDGNFYGSCFYGGVGGIGTVLKMTPSGTLTTLYSFSSLTFQNYNPDGAHPAPLFEAANGILYGTTCAGGSTGFGTLFSLKKTGGSATVLQTFGMSFGYESLAGLCQDSQGLLYGTTSLGGTNNTGTLFSLLPSSADLGPPTTTAAPSGTQGTNGWYTSPVQITLSATDPDGANDVAVTSYTVDGGPQQTYFAPFTVTGDGLHTITFWSGDTAGNTESAHSQAINIDAAAPSVTFGAAAPAPNAAGWNNSAVTLSCAVADAVSGVATATPSSPLSFGSEGIHQTQTVTATDNAGNTVTLTTPAISIDMTTPITTATVSGDSIALSASDALSGVASTLFTVDGGAQQTYSSSSPIIVTGIGTHTVAYWSTDRAGNTEAQHTVSTTVTATDPPITSALVSGPNGANGWYTGAVSVSLSATDPDGPDDVAATYDTLDGSQQTLYTAALSVSSEGTHTLTYWSVDNEGDSESPHILAVPIDSVPPVTTASVSGATVTLSAADATSGVANTVYSVDGGSYQTYSAAFTVTGYGTHTVACYSTDNAGNAETPQSASVSVPYPAPTLTTITPTSTIAGGPAFTLTVTGTGFVGGASVLQWNGTALATTFVSASKLTAKVPASLVASAGAFPVTVLNPSPGGGASHAQTFTVTLTSMNVTAETPTRDASTGIIHVPIVVQNTGHNAAPNLQITASKWGGYTTVSSLPIPLGTLAPGASAAATLAFPGKTGTAGSVKTLSVSGTYDGGTWSRTVSVTLP